ncbi:MAG: anion permease [Candidatus Hadarchaeaceae archaeon]
MIELIVVLVGFFAAWNIGANDTANCVGVAVGGRVLSYRRAIAIVIFFVLLGAILEGWKNMTTVGTGIIIPGPSGVNPLSEIPLATIAVLIATGLWVLMATTLGLPISTSQSMVGAVIGAGLLITFLRPDLGASVQYSKLGAIGLSWVLNPIIAALLAFIILKIISPLLRRIKNIVLLNKVLAILVIVAASYSAYALGANDVGTSTGAIYAFFGGSPRIIALFGAVALAVGTITFSRRVMHTVGTGITRLGPVTAFAAQFGAALTVWSFVQFGMPVSTSQAIIGAVAGAGLVKGAATVSQRKLHHIGIVWVLTPAVACVFSFLLGWLFLSL